MGWEDMQKSSGNGMKGVYARIDIFLIDKNIESL